MDHDHERRLAVLIDADNATPRLAPAIFEEVATLGDATVRRIYGDFADSPSGWTSRIMLEHGIIPQQQFAYTKGKNASDITMVIDAMDLMHRGGLDGFCLVTSDSDFTRLAQRLREEGLLVYGFGQKKTPTAFQKACSRFIFVENLTDAPVEEGEQAAAKKEPPSKAVPLLRKALADLEDDDGWTTLGQLGKQVLHHEPAFDARTYGSSKLSDLVVRTGKFEIDRPKGGGGVRVRYKGR